MIIDTIVIPITFEDWLVKYRDQLELDVVDWYGGIRVDDQFIVTDNKVIDIEADAVEKVKRLATLFEAGHPNKEVRIRVVTREEMRYD